MNLAYARTIEIVSVIMLIVLYTYNVIDYFIIKYTRELYKYSNEYNTALNNAYTALKNYCTALEKHVANQAKYIDVLEKDSPATQEYIAILKEAQGLLKPRM